MKSNKITEDTEIEGIELIATEMDSSTDDIRFFTRESCDDTVSLEMFDGTLKEILMAGEKVVDITEDCSLFEYQEFLLTIYQNINSTILLVNKEDEQKLNYIFSKYR